MKYKKLSILIPVLFFIASLFVLPDIALAADRYWVGDNGTWNTTANWSATSGGAGGESVPTSADNCFFDDAGFSGAVRTVTIMAEANCADMTWLTTTGQKTLGLNNDGNQLHIYGSLTLASGMAVTGNTDEILFDAAAGTHSITSNGVSIDLDISFNGAAGTWVLQDNLSTTKSIALTAGTLDANDFDVTASDFDSNNSNVRTLFMGTGTWTLNQAGSQWDISDSTNMTLNPQSSTLTFNAADASQKDFYGGGLSYQNVHFNGRNIVIHDSNVYNDTFAVNNAGLTDALFVQNGTTQVVTNFTTNGSAGNLANIAAYTGGGGCTPFTLSKSSGTVSVDYMNISCSAATGGATWYAGANSADGGGNTGWIFAAPTDRYWVGGTGTWDASDTTHWAEVSGGPGGFSVPTNTNNCFFDANSFSGGGQTVTITAEAHCADMTWTTADAPSLVSSADLYITGSLTLASGMTVSFSSGAIYFYAVDAQTITSNAVTIDAHFYFATAGTWTLQDNLSVGEYFALVEGTFDANDFDVLADAFYSSYTNTRALTMGSGTWTLNGIGSVWDITNPTNLTFDAETSTIVINDTGGAAKDFFGGGLTYNSITSSGNHIIINGSNTFNTINVDNAGLSDGLYFNSNLQNTITNFTTNGSSGNLAIIQSDAGGPFILSKSGGTVSVDYMSIYNSTATGGATWYAGANSVDAGGNSGWIFTAPPVTPAPSTPTASPVAGTYTSTQSVTLASTNSTSIRYTTDGSTPTCSVGTVYAGAFNVASSQTVNAIGCNGTGDASASFVYTINSSSGGGSGGGSRRVSPPFMPIGEICKPGDLFSTTSGKPCPPYPEGCTAFTKYSPLTGQLCPVIKLALPAQVLIQTPLTPFPFYFNRDLALGATGEDVVRLQQFLVARGYLVIPANIRYGLFADLTFAALVKFQEQYYQEILAPLGLTRGTGFFGPSTRAFINTLP